MNADDSSNHDDRRIHYRNTPSNKSPMSSIFSIIPSLRGATTVTFFLVLLLILGIIIPPENLGVEAFSVSTPAGFHRRSQPSYPPTALFQESTSSSSSNNSDDVSSSINMDNDRDKDATVGEFNKGELLHDLLVPKKTCKVDQMSGTELGGWQQITTLCLCLFYDCSCVCRCFHMLSWELSSSHLTSLHHILGFSFLSHLQPILETLYSNSTFDLAMSGLLDERQIFKIVWWPL